MARKKNQEDDGLSYAKLLDREAERLAKTCGFDAVIILASYPESKQTTAMVQGLYGNNYAHKGMLEEGITMVDPYDSDPIDGDIEYEEEDDGDEEEDAYL